MQVKGETVIANDPAIASDAALNALKWRGEQFFCGHLLAYNSVLSAWSIEHYNKCSFRCAYCSMDSQGNSVPVPAPERLVALLDADISGAQQTGLFKTGETRLILSSLTDPYVAIDQQTGLTRQVIEYLIDRGHVFSVATRGGHIKRDLDLLAACGSQCDVYFALPIVDAGAMRRFEPHLPPLESRLEALKAILEAGITTKVDISPWIPGVSQVDRTLRLLPSGVDVTVSPLFVETPLMQGDPTCPVPTAELKQGDRFLLQRFGNFAHYGFCQTATRLFPGLTQADINSAYIRERNRIGFRPRVRWVYPLLDGCSFSDIAFRYLRPGELEA